MHQELVTGFEVNGRLFSSEEQQMRNWPGGCGKRTHLAHARLCFESCYKWLMIRQAGVLVSVHLHSSTSTLVFLFFLTSSFVMSPKRGNYISFGGDSHEVALTKLPSRGDLENTPYSHENCSLCQSFLILLPTHGKLFSMDP